MTMPFVYEACPLLATGTQWVVDIIARDGRYQPYYRSNRPFCNARPLDHLSPWHVDDLCATNGHEACEWFRLRREGEQPKQPMRSQEFWTDAQVAALIAGYHAGLLVKDIARLPGVNRSFGSTRVKLHRLRADGTLPPRPHHVQRKFGVSMHPIHVKRRAERRQRRLDNTPTDTIV